MPKKEKKMTGTNMIIISLVIAAIVIVANDDRKHMEHIEQMENMEHINHEDMEGIREKFITQKNQIVGELITKGMYKCCLEKPCTYCIEKTPGHGEGAECNCLKDVVEGVHPCGECIGEILEGHGNPYLAEYFAKAIAEKTGHENAIKQIISEKYGISIGEQA